MKGPGPDARHDRTELGGVDLHVAQPVIDQRREELAMTPRVEAAALAAAEDASGPSVDFVDAGADGGRGGVEGEDEHDGSA